MMNDLKQYPAYKDSSVPWLDEIPEHWLLRRTKHLIRERVQKGFPNESLLAATQTKGVVRKDQYENRTVLALKDLHLLKLVEKGDFVISLRSFQGGIEYSRERGIISPAYTVLYSTQSETHDYLAWLFKSKPYIENLSLYVTGIRQGQNIDYEKLGRSELPFPPLPEQSSIVHFLDHADRRIKRCLLAKRKMIQLLAERRNIATQNAVKLATNNWMRIENVAKIIEQPISRLDEQVYTPIGLYNRGRGIFHKTPTKGSELGDSTFFWLSEGDLVLSGQFAWEGAIAIVGQEDAGCIASHRYPILRGRPDIVESSFLLSFFKTGWGQLLLDYHSRGAAGRNRPLNIDRLVKEKIPIPPMHVQHEIGEMIDQEKRLHQEVINYTLHLHEYRTKLIADVVTGKLDVREAVKNLSDEVGEVEIPEEVDLIAEGDGGDEENEHELTEIEA